MMVMIMLVVIIVWAALTAKAFSIISSKLPATPASDVLSAIL